MYKCVFNHRESGDIIYFEPEVVLGYQLLYRLCFMWLIFHSPESLLRFENNRIYCTTEKVDVVNQQGSIRDFTVWIISDCGHVSYLTPRPVFQGGNKERKRLNVSNGGEVETLRGG